MKPRRSIATNSSDSHDSGGGGTEKHRRNWQYIRYRHLTSNRSHIFRVLETCAGRLDSNGFGFYFVTGAFEELMRSSPASLSLTISNIRCSDARRTCPAPNWRLRQFWPRCQYSGHHRCCQEQPELSQAAQGTASTPARR